MNKQAAATSIRKWAQENGHELNEYVINDMAARVHYSMEQLQQEALPAAIDNAFLNIGTFTKYHVQFLFDAYDIHFNVQGVVAKSGTPDADIHAMAANKLWELFDIDIADIERNLGTQCHRMIIEQSPIE